MNPAIYMMGRSGRAIDILNPTPAAVNFREIADHLSRIDRYNGAFETPISVAQHTVIACALVDETVKPWVLAHDFHEQRVGDIITPQVDMLAEIAGEGFDDGAIIVRYAVREAKRRHDAAIYTAAGLPLPNEEQRRWIERADIVAMRTEIRDFNGGHMCAEGWPEGFDAIAPLRQVFRYRAPPDAADELYALMQRYLPTLNGGHYPAPKVASAPAFGVRPIHTGPAGPPPPGGSGVPTRTPSKTGGANG